MKNPSVLLTTLRAAKFLPRMLATVLTALFLAAALTLPTVNAASPTVTGYNGTQTFVTAVGKDPGEPNACGVVGGSSYWFTYKPPTNGVVSFNTTGSSYDTVLGIYLDNGSNAGYSSLIAVTCNDNCSTNTLTSCVQWTGDPKTNYYIMLDGVNGATGTAYLNYSLNARPNISTIAAQSIAEDTNTAVLAFTISDRETTATNLTLTGISTNQTWVGTTNIVFGGSGTNRTVKVTPKKDQWGTNYITLVVTDPGGASNTTSFQLKVSSVNDVPVTFPDTVTRLSGKSITIARSFPPRNDTDVDGDTLTLTAVTSPSVGGVTITMNTTNIIYSPATNYNSADRFTYTISDGKGATATGTNYVNVGTNGVLVVY